MFSSTAANPLAENFVLDFFYFFLHSYFDFIFLQMDYIDVGTSLSNMHYLGQPEGETYGLDHGKTYRYHPETSMYLRPESGVPGLYLTGRVTIFSSPEPKAHKESL